MTSLFTIALMVGCDSSLSTIDGSKDAVIVEEEDETPPTIEHTPITGTQTFGSDVAIEATVTDGEDGVGVLFVYLNYKNEIDGSDGWEKLILTASGDVYTGTIPGEDHRGGGVDYFIEAIDRMQNAAFSPEDGESDPYHFRIAE